MQAICPVCHKVEMALFQPTKEERDTANWDELRHYVMADHEYPDVKGMECPGVGQKPVAGYHPVDVEV